MATGINFDLISVHKYIELSGQYLQLSKISLTHVNLSFSGVDSNKETKTPTITVTT